MIRSRGQQPPALAALQDAVLSDGEARPSKFAARRSRPSRATGPARSGCSTRTQKGELPKELVAEAGRLLRNSPVPGPAEQGAARASPRRASSTRRSCPPIAELAKRTGDAARGKAVLDASARRRGAVLRSATWSAASAGRSAPTCR